MELEHDHVDGVLPDTCLIKAIDEGLVASAAPIPERNIQPSSVDLRLGTVAYQLGCSFLPDNELVSSKIERLKEGSFSIEHGAVLQRSTPYLIPLQESLRLPSHLRARANPKSSTGRLDIFTRVITDRGSRFDDVRAGYRGPLYLEVVSRSFPVKVMTGLSLNQIRIMTEGSRPLTDAAIRDMHEDNPVLFYKSQELRSNVQISNGLFMSLDLTGDADGAVGYKARPNGSRILDLSKTDYYEVEDFWDSVTKLDGDRIILRPEEFYLLLSAEAVRIPPDYASEMVAYDPTSGELRTHYAGFFDPGFGHDPGRLRGSRATLEVRAHDVPFMIENRQPVCKLTFEPMVHPPKLLYGQDLASNYQGQTLTVSKHFKVPRPFANRQPRLPFPDGSD